MAGILIISFIFALAFAIPTYGFSILGWILIALIVFHKYRANEQNSYEIKKANALKKFMKLAENTENYLQVIDKLPMPTWFTNKLAKFFSGVGEMAIKNGMPEAVMQMYARDVPFLTFLAGVAALMEQEGASFSEQQKFIAEMLLDGLDKAFSERS